MIFTVFDLECGSLDSDRSSLYCGGFKPLGGKKKILELKGMQWGRGRQRDKYLALAIRDEIESYDGIITWNGIMFDIPFLNDRLMICGEDPVEKRFHIDIMYQARWGKSRLSSAHLDRVATSLKCPFTKTPLSMDTWMEAEFEISRRWREGDENYRYIIEHNSHDLDVTEWTYNQLKNRVQTISKR